MIRPLDEQAARAVLSNLREWDRKEAIAGLGPDFFEPAVKLLLEQDHGWSYSLKDEPVAVVGGSTHGDTFDLFMLATPKFVKARLGLTRFSISTIMPTFADSTASRAECLSDPGHVDAHNWMRRLGGQPVEYLIGIGRQGEDMVRWRWTREDVHPYRRRNAVG